MNEEAVRGELESVLTICNCLALVAVTLPLASGMPTICACTPEMPAELIALATSVSDIVFRLTLIDVPLIWIAPEAAVPSVIDIAAPTSSVELASAIDPAPAPPLLVVTLWRNACVPPVEGKSPSDSKAVPLPTSLADSPLSAPEELDVKLS